MSTSTPATDRIGDLLRSAEDDRLVRELFTDVKNIARSVLGSADPHLLLTVTHDVLLTVLRHRDGFRGESRGASWLYTITRREAVHAAMREKRRYQRERGLDGHPDEHHLPEIAVHPRPDAKLLAQEFLHERVANPDWRRIWLLHNDPGQRLSHQEIGRLTGRTPGTIAVTLSRVRALLAGV